MENELTRIFHTTKSTKNTKCYLDSSCAKIRARLAKNRMWIGTLGSISLTSFTFILFVVFVSFVVNYPD